jgi:predicted acetyltransferase
MMSSMSPTALRLRPLRLGDEPAFVEAHRELLAEDFQFGVAYDGQPFERYLMLNEAFRLGVGLPDGLVDATFLVADVGGEIVGRVSIRHRLNDFLLREGGHVGYAVRPAYRGRGYATEILRQSLVVCRALGIDRVLATCDDDNEASIRVIERCGGVLENVLTDTANGVPKRRYWID